MQTKTIYNCQKCGAQTSKWAGRCFECGGWGCLSEETKRLKEIKSQGVQPGKPVGLHEIKTQTTARTTTGIGEVDRVLGNGIPAGAVILLAGEPGIGKSTLVAQIASTLGQDVLYVSGEESPEQLKARFARLPKPASETEQIAILSNTNAETIAATIESQKPALTIIDSIQTITADAAEDRGALTQLRASTAILAETAKKSNLPIILIGQVTKSLDIAGPKSLEHLVDIVLTFEGDRHGIYRLLRAVKNRFGATDEIGVFQMTNAGLQEVKNPSAAFLETRSQAPGSVVTCVLEGSRPILVELQALATKSHFHYPERRASGFEANRLNMLIAVLEKQMAACKMPPYNVGRGFTPRQHDIHLNVTSGFRIKEPAADLAVLTAIASSLSDKPIPKNLLAFGEVGLGGEIRPVRDPERRINEAKKLGFTQFITPKSHTSLKEALLFLNVV